MTAAPDVRITVYPPSGEPEDITLSYPLDPRHAELLRSLHGCTKGVIECRMHDDAPALWDLRGPDGRVRGIWMLLRQNPYASEDTFPLLLCHWPRSIVGGNHVIPAGMTSEHRSRQEFIARRGTEIGWDAQLEKSIAPGTRSDVVITGPAVMTAEVQQSGISVPTLLRRDAKVVAVDATPVWFADSKAPPWAFKVAHTETNARTGMARGMWTVSSGPRVLEYERCTPSAPRPCPDGRRWCGHWHPFWKPWPGLTVDDIVEMVPGGGMVRFDTRSKQGVVLAKPSDREEWESSRPEVYYPASVTARPRPAARGQVRHNAYDDTALRDRVSRPLIPPPHQVPLTRHESAALEHLTQMLAPAQASPVCARCRTRLIACYPGQTLHPECDPNPPTWTQEELARWLPSTRRSG